MAPYLALTAHTIQVNHFSISQRTWDKLPTDLQMLVEDTAVAASDLGLEKAIGYESEFVSSLQKEHGVTVTRPDKAEFMAVLKPVQDELAAKMKLIEVLQMIRSKL